MAFYVIVLDLRPAVTAVLLREVPSPSATWLVASVAYIVYYVTLSFWLTARRPRQPVLS